MDADAADLSRTVEYSRDRHTMDTIPLGLLGILAGLAFLVYIDPRPTGRETMPPGLPGGILVLIGLGYIAYALARNRFPAKPMLKLSPAGIWCHSALIKDALIPWHEVQDVADFDLTGPHGPPHRYPDVTAVLVSQDFYQRHLLPKQRYSPSRFEWLLVFFLPHSRTISLGAGWDDIFVPKGSLMQMALAHPIWFKIEAKDIREPVEARWKAFRDRREPTTSVPRTNSRTATSRTKAEPSREPAQVYGKWLPRLTPWKAVQYIVPLIGILAVLTHALVK